MRVDSTFGQVEGVEGSPYIRMKRSRRIMLDKLIDRLTDCC